MNILVTKVLPKQLKRKLIESNFSVFEEDFIAVQQLIFKIDKIPDYLIFTSQNAVKSVLKNEKVVTLKKIKCLCVGKKTKKKLEENGFKVIVDCKNAKWLSEQIIQKFADNSFLFFSGNSRRDDLPLALKNAKVILDEKVVYETKLTPKKTTTTFEAIAFFSPSAVESYLINNTITNERCFCIGETTAKALENVTKNIIIASEPTVENVINEVLKQ